MDEAEEWVESTATDIVNEIQSDLPKILGITLFIFSLVIAFTVWVIQLSEKNLKVKKSGGSRVTRRFQGHRKHA